MPRNFCLLIVLVNAMRSLDWEVGYQCEYLDWEPYCWYDSLVGTRYRYEFEGQKIVALCNWCFQFGIEVEGPIGPPKHWVVCRPNGKLKQC